MSAVQYTVYIPAKLIFKLTRTKQRKKISKNTQYFGIIVVTKPVLRPNCEVGSNQSWLCGGHWPI